MSANRHTDAEMSRSPSQVDVGSTLMPLQSEDGEKNSSSNAQLLFQGFRGKVSVLTHDLATLQCGQFPIGHDVDVL